MTLNKTKVPSYLFHPPPPPVLWTYNEHTINLCRNEFSLEAEPSFQIPFWQHRGIPEHFTFRWSFAQLSMTSPYTTWGGGLWPPKQAYSLQWEGKRDGANMKQPPLSYFNPIPLKNQAASVMPRLKGAPASKTCSFLRSNINGHRDFKYLLTCHLEEGQHWASKVLNTSVDKRIQKF